MEQETISELTNIFFIVVSLMCLNIKFFVVIRCIVF
jgi:hypothetical protein